MGKRPVVSVKPRAGRWNEVTEHIKNLFFERISCPVCGCESQGICSVCMSQLEFWGAYEIEELSGWAMVHYQGPARQLINKFKQSLSYDALDGINALIDCWWQELGKSILISKDGPVWDYLVPIPSIPRKVRQRGFDPAFEIARRVSSLSGIPILRCLDNRGQAEHKGMNLRERRIAADEGFAVIKDWHGLCRGKRLLLFDDIMTSGTTILSAAQLLAESSTRVNFLVLERAAL